ncbi:hypothetical protein BTO20_09715 [Mycobacterium dioxanotrophicus]|uniref:Uncharacterized protein n=1 Tax=Mycobacterium dioxanotrophicus TaxID=482462 RepID=A0A1Y0C0X1_9MYCO|nr:hypothetical protein [Mycobacterium dioxanotrophicus]ART68829.1 hypothetical protein BTO20_09715 [Mycobacterium dioxanotrophicus]
MFRPIVGFALTAAMLAACTTPPPPAPSADAEGPAAAPPTTAVPPAVFQLGQRVTNIPTLNYAVTSIVVDGLCPGPTIPSTHGHLLLVGLDVQTAPAFTAGNARGILSPYGGAGWSIIGPDGITQTGLTSSATYICADSQIPPVFAPNQHYAYKLAFDTSHTTGTLQYQVEYVISRWKY